MPVGDWVCSPCAVVVPASPSGSPALRILTAGNGARAHGARAAKAGAQSSFLSFFLSTD
jgi:hypothetical protein